VTARKDDVPAAVQAAIVNVAGLNSSSAGGGSIQTTLADANSELLVTSAVGFAGVLARTRQRDADKSRRPLRCDVAEASRT